jgi:DNA invertase Pin-like site-specific DNA recombinase
MSPAGTRVVGYTRVSTQEQADSGAGLAAQKAAIEAAAAARGWQVVTILEDRGVSAKSTKGRGALAAAIALVEAGGADALVVSKLDRLSRSLIDFAALMEQARCNRWAIAILDCGFDMLSPTGELMAHMLACFAQFERRVIAQRTRDGLAAKKAAGVQLGRPRTVSDRVVQRIIRERDESRSLGAIARGLTEDAIPTGQGGVRWYASTVRAIVSQPRPEPSSPTGLVSASRLPEPRQIATRVAATPQPEPRQVTIPDCWGSAAGAAAGHDQGAAVGVRSAGG